jgi:hypothetical protein
LLLWGFPAELCLPSLHDLPRVLCCFLSSSSLTPPVSGRRPTVAVRFKQIRKRAAVTSTGWLGSNSYGSQDQIRANSCFPPLSSMCPWPTITRSKSHSRIRRSDARVALGSVTYSRWYFINAKSPYPSCSCAHVRSQAVQPSRTL